MWVLTWSHVVASRKVWGGKEASLSSRRIRNEAGRFYHPDRPARLASCISWRPGGGTGRRLLVHGEHRRERHQERQLLQLGPDGQLRAAVPEERQSRVPRDRRAHVDERPGRDQPVGGDA